MSRLTSANPLGFLLNDTSRLFRQLFEKIVTENGLGLTPGEIRALGHAVRFAGSRQAALAERMGVEPMTLSAYLDRLEGRKLIVRKVDPADRRAKLVEPTQAGCDILKQLDPLFDKVYEQATHGLDQAQIDTLTESLRTILTNLTSDTALLRRFDLLDEADKAERASRDADEDAEREQA